MGTLAARNFWRRSRTAPDRGAKPQLLHHQSRRWSGLPLEPARLFPRGSQLRAHRLLQPIAEQFPTWRRNRFPLLEKRLPEIRGLPSKSPSDLLAISGRTRLPNFAGLLAHHRLALLATKGLCKLRHVRKRSVAAESGQRMRVGVSHQSRVLDPLVGAPDLRPAEKEALLRSKSVFVRRPRLALKLFKSSGLHQSFKLPFESNLLP